MATLSNLDLQTFRTKLDQFGQVARSCRFAVLIEPQGTNILAGQPNFYEMLYVCDAFEFPGRGFDTTEVRYFGPKREVPTNSLYQPANASFICRNKTTERKLFDDWLDIINPIDGYNFNFPSDYYARITVWEFHDIGKSTGATSGPKIQTPTGQLGMGTTAGATPLPVYAWQLNDAWPTLVAPQPVTWADQDILRLQVTFTYRNWERIPLV